MAKTQAEKIDELTTAVELLTAQQRIIIKQHDKTLEFVDAIYTGMAQEAQEPAPTPPAEHMPAQHATGMIKGLVSDEGEQARPKASTSWGRNDGNREASPGAQPQLGQACRRRVRDRADRIPPRGTGER